MEPSAAYPPSTTTGCTSSASSGRTVAWTRSAAAVSPCAARSAASAPMPRSRRRCSVTMLARQVMSSAETTIAGSSQSWRVAKPSPAGFVLGAR